MNLLKGITIYSQPGDYVFSDKGHLLSKVYYQQVGRYRFGLVPDSSTLPFANFKQNSFLTGVSLSWLKTPKNSLRTINYTPNLLYERFEGIEGATNNLISINSPFAVDLSMNTHLNFDLSYSMNQFSIKNGNSNAKHLVRLDPNVEFNKFNSVIKIGVSPVLINSEFHLYPDIAYKKILKDTNFILSAGWHAVPNQLEITTQDSKFIALNISNGKRLNYGFSFSFNNYTNLLLFNKKTNTNLLNNGLYYNSIFENKASTIQFDANLRYQFSDHL